MTVYQPRRGVRFREKSYAPTGLWSPLLLEEGRPRNARSGWSGMPALPKNAFREMPQTLTTPPAPSAFGCRARAPLLREEGKKRLPADLANGQTPGPAEPGLLHCV